MNSRGDILDRPEPLWGGFWGSVALHVSVGAGVFLAAWVQAHRPHEEWGDIHGGGIGSVAVTPVARIPLPAQSGPVNPVANDTESRAPTPPPKAKAQPAVKEDLDAIPLPSRNARRKAAQAAAAPNKFREKQEDLPNQVFSQSGQHMVTPMVGMSGGGGVSMGNNSPFGAQFGPYSDMVQEKVRINWKTKDIDPRIRTANEVVVTFTILSDGSVRSVKVKQSSGILPLDLSAQRAVLDAAPFQPLPLQFPRKSADIEFHFELRR